MFKKKQIKSISFRIAKELNDLIVILSDKLMISKTAVFTMAITELAKEKGLLNRDETQLNMEELAAEVGKQFESDLAPIGDAIVTVANDLKDVKDRLDQLEKTKQIKDKAETPRFVFNLQRASEDTETVVTEDDA